MMASEANRAQGTGIGSQTKVAATIDGYRWLVSEAGERGLASVRGEIEAAGGPSVALTSRLRKDLSLERAHLVIEQIELRQRAREKFSLADRMYFTRKGLEQATDEQLAAYKASRFPPGQTISDLCCGLGGDLLALARHGRAQGIDR